MSDRVVITMHGVRTRGVWQKDLVPLLVRAGFVPYAIDYDYFSTFSLMRLSKREEKVRWFVDQYDRIRAETGIDRPSVIAHSFGTRIVADALEHNPEIKFDKVIFCGSIVREDFDWPSRIAMRQVNFVENDYGSLDVWPTLAKRFIGGSGNAGTDGFLKPDLMLTQRKFPKYVHSDYFSRTHFERYWVRTLVLDTRRLRTLLAYVAGLAAKKTGADRESVRAYIFVPERTRQYLRIPADLHVGLAHDEALRTIPIDIDAVVSPGIGEAYGSGRPTLLQIGADFRWDLLPTTSGIGPHPSLCWVLSTPISTSVGGRVSGVFCVDGLSPGGDAALEGVLADVVPFAQQLADQIAAAEPWL